MGKKVLLLASGGLDSSYLLYKNMQEGNEVRLLYIDIKNNGFKSKKERKSIKLQKKYYEDN